MKTRNTIIIGGGAAGLFCALLLKKDALILERGNRVGRKLAATGNGQGNVSNVNLSVDDYFSSGDVGFVKQSLEKFGRERMLEVFEKAGAMFSSDERGRIYPACRQASSLTDLMRFNLDVPGKEIKTDCFVVGIKKNDGVFSVICNENGSEKEYRAHNVVLCAGGKAAKNFGTDGNGYDLAVSAGHTVTRLHPSLVQLKTDTRDVKTLRGIRAFCAVTAKCGGKIVKTLRGDVIFTDYGVSGDAIFRISAYVADKINEGVTLSLDFMPDADETVLDAVLTKKKKNAAVPESELFCGILNNQIGRAVLKKSAAGGVSPARLVKDFGLKVTGTLGFDYAQVTKGGVPVTEVYSNMESKKVKNLYLAGEILDVDGQCGGYNLQWAFTSAAIAAESINDEQARIDRNQT